jgi:hypothetical protein
MSKILEPLVQRLRRYPSSSWDEISLAAGCAKTLVRKLASRDRTNPQIDSIEPLFAYFDAVDTGRAQLPLSATDCTARRKPRAPLERA